MAVKKCIILEWFVSNKVVQGQICSITGLYNSTRACIRGVNNSAQYTRAEKELMKVNENTLLMELALTQLSLISQR